MFLQKSGSLQYPETNLTLFDAYGDTSLFSIICFSNDLYQDAKSILELKALDLTIFQLLLNDCHQWLMLARNIDRYQLFLINLVRNMLPLNLQCTLQFTVTPSLIIFDK